MQTLFYSQEVLKSYDVSVKIRKNGQIILRKYQSPIIYKDDNFEEFDKSFIDICNVRKITKINELSVSSRDDHDNSLVEFVKNLEKEEIRADNLARTRELLIDYSSQNADKFHSFITLTFGDEVTEVSQANRLFNNYISSTLRNQKKKGNEFYYLGVPEFQKNGRVHYHILTSLKHDIDIPKREPIKTYNKEKKKYYNIEYYDIPYWTYGYSSSFDLDNETDDNFNLSLYIIKYLYKDLDQRLFNRKKILKSNNLEKPDVFKLSQNSTCYKTAMRYIENLLLNKKIEIQSIKEVKPTIDQPYLKTQQITNLNLQDNDNILKEILQDREEF